MTNQARSTWRSRADRRRALEPTVAGTSTPERGAGRADRATAGRHARNDRSPRTRVRHPDRDVTLVAASPLEEVSRSVDSLTALSGSASPPSCSRSPRGVVLVGRACARRCAPPRGDHGASMDQRVPEPGTGDEVDQLAHTMNSMLERLERRRTTNGASCPTRRTSCAARSRRSGRPSRSRGAAPSADWPDVARRVLADDERLERMVDELLELARLDETRADGHRRRCPRSTSTSCVLDETVQPRHRERRHPDRVSAGRVHGRRAQLAPRRAQPPRQRDSPRAARRVAVSLRRRRALVTLTVDDDGPGIAADDRERVFERFTRLEEGRAATPVAPGSASRWCGRSSSVTAARSPSTSATSAVPASSCTCLLSGHAA